MNTDEKKLNLAMVEIAGQVSELLDKHQQEIEQTYFGNPGKLNINLIIKLSPTKDRQETEVETKISFVADRIRDNKKGKVGERQMTMEEVQAEEARQAGYLEGGDDPASTGNVREFKGRKKAAGRGETQEAAQP